MANQESGKDDSPIHTIRNESTTSRSNSMGNCSVSSEASAAIVSVYNSWSVAPQPPADPIARTLEYDPNDVGDDDDDDTLSMDCRFSDLPPVENLNDLWDELKKRLPEADLPPRLTKRSRRRGPTCRFYNFRGSRLPPLPLPPPPPPLNPLNELGLSANDALFPMDIGYFQDSNDPLYLTEQPPSDEGNDVQDVGDVFECSKTKVSYDDYVLKTRLPKDESEANITSANLRYSAQGTKFETNAAKA